MDVVPKILAFAGSTRTESFNKRLVALAAAGARATGAEVTVIDLREFPLPLYDADLESREGLPQNAGRLKNLFLGHHGLLIAAPEYNSSITAVLKNTIDWVSRPVPGETSLGCFQGKLACIMSASPGVLGGLRGQVHVRAILQNLKVLVLPDQIAIVKAHEAFNPDGSLKDPNQQAAVEAVGAKLARMIARLQG